MKVVYKNQRLEKVLTIPNKLVSKYGNYSKTIYSRFILLKEADGIEDLQKLKFLNLKFVEDPESEHWILPINDQLSFKFKYIFSENKNEKTLMIINLN